MAKIRVLEVVCGFGYGGIRAFIMNNLTYINKDKFDIDIYAFGVDSSPFTEQVRQLGANIYFEPKNDIITHNILRFIRQLSSYMKEHGPYDVVHSHNNLNSAWVLLAAKIANVHIRLSHSHTSSHFGKSLVKNAYSYLRLFLINRLATRKIACGQLAGEAMYGKKAKFLVVSNGIKIDNYITANKSAVNLLRNELGIPDNVRVYANISRMDVSKNHIFAVEVFNEIHKIDPQAIFIYGGVIPPNGSTVQIVETRIKELGLKNHCIFTGPVMNVSQLYHLSDAWIYCSAYEGLPFGPLELQAAGIPILASDIITKEIDLGLGLVHFLSLNDPPRLWAEKIVSLNKVYNSEERVYETFRANNFDITLSVNSLEALYEGKA